jgi:hypothetical protein
VAFRLKYLKYRVRCGSMRRAYLMAALLAAIRC